jgi:hypothetical protein
MKLILTEKQTKKIISEVVNEDIYFTTFSGAVQHARQKAEEKGYEINEDDWWHEVNVGKGRPKEGDTTRATLGLSLNGKPQRKALHIQVFNRGNQVKHNFELNYYIS